MPPERCRRATLRTTRRCTLPSSKSICAAVTLSRNSAIPCQNKDGGCSRPKVPSHIETLFFLPQLLLARAACTLISDQTQGSRPFEHRLHLVIYICACDAARLRGQRLRSHAVDSLVCPVHQQQHWKRWRISQLQRRSSVSARPSKMAH